MASNYQTYYHYVVIQPDTPIQVFAASKRILEGDRRFPFISIEKEFVAKDCRFKKDDEVVYTYSPAKGAPSKASEGVVLMTEIHSHLNERNIVEYKYIIHIHDNKSGNVFKKDEKFVKHKALVPEVDLVQIEQNLIQARKVEEAAALIKAQRKEEQNEIKEISATIEYQEVETLVAEEELSVL